MYTITQYSYDQAEKLGVFIRPSKYANKKIDVYDSKNKYICSVGDSTYKDYPTFIIEKGKAYANKRRKAYKIRHEKDRLIYGTAGYYADKILW